MISSIAAKLWNVSTDKEAQQIKKLEWVEYRFLPTPGFKEWRSGQHSIPMVEDWRFSPSGRIGVSIVTELGTGFVVLLMDVHNKLWFAHSIPRDVRGNWNIITYHMFNDESLVVVGTGENSSVTQKIIKVNMETRTAEPKNTIVHSFAVREETPLFSNESVATPHVAINVKGKRYTVLVGSSRMDKRRMFVYLVPVNPLCLYSPMEFHLKMELSAEKAQLWKSLSGTPSYWFRFAYFSSGGRLYFASVIRVLDETVTNYLQIVNGVYLTVDVAKLIDIHNKPIENMERFDMQQGASMRVFSYPWSGPITAWSALQCKYRGAFMMFGSFSLTQLTNTSNCHVLESPRLMQIKTISDSWLNLHPRGAVLQFKMSSIDKRLYVRVAAHWKNTLSSLANNKLIFHPNNPVNSIAGLHRVIFGNLPPFKLDEAAQKALNGTYEEYKNMLKRVNYSQ